MDDQNRLFELIEQSQLEDSTSLNQLSERVRPKIQAYINRVTLDEDLSQDLTQDTLMQMVKSLGKLQDRQRFWPWLYRIAMSKVQQHYRDQKRSVTARSITLEESLLQNCPFERGGEGLGTLVRKELADYILSAMETLGPKKRAVLCLRYFEELEYSEVANVLGCSEASARLMFYRARRAMQKQLSRRGIGKSTFVLALGWFGGMTLPADAASAGAAVAAEAGGHVGAVGATLGWLSSKTGIATVLSALVFAALLMSFQSEGAVSRDQVRSVHFVQHEPRASSGRESSLSFGAFEKWCYFPKGIDGPMYFRMQRWNPEMTKQLCSWLQNGRGCYYYHSGKKTVYIRNNHLWYPSLEIWRQPTDSPSFRDYLQMMDGQDDKTTYTCDDSGLIQQSRDGRFVDVGEFTCDYEYNGQGETDFAYLWADNIEVVDLRDAMHKKGWTWFQVEGELAGRPVTGTGCLPFYYDSLSEHPPQLTLRIGDTVLHDCSDGAWLANAGQCQGVYPAGCFLRGMARPWMGLHTLDIVRRDAAENEIPFTTEIRSDQSFATVTLKEHQDYHELQLVYTINIENEMIESVIIQKTGGGQDDILGKLAFHCVDSLPESGLVDSSQLVPPPTSRAGVESSPPGFWLMDLACGRLLN